MVDKSQNLDEVNNHIRELQELYTEVPVEERQEVVAADEFEHLTGHHRDDYLGAAYAWVVRTPEDASALSESFYPEPGSSKRVLFHLPRASNMWGLPGGGVEGDESFEEAAVREVREETGIDCAVTGLWLLRRLKWISDDETDPRSSYSMQVFFDAQYTGGSIAIQPGESNGAAWFADLPPADRMLPANRIRAESWPSDA